MKNTVDNKRLWILLGATALMSIILLWRLTQLQIFQSDRFLEVSEGNRVRAVEIDPVRGKIFDRQGNLMVDNRPSFSVFVVPYEIRRRRQTADFLVDLLGIDRQSLDTKIAQHRSQPFQPVRIARDVPFAGVAALEERMSEYPGVLIRIEAKRYYSVDIAPHIIGYIGELSREDPKKFPGLKAGDIVGKTGLELQYDQILRGEKGVKYIQVDALGRELEEVYHDKAVHAVPGKDIYLTLDLHLMEYADSLLGNRPGSVVAMDPWTGEIYVLLSKPRYDPDIFSGVMSPETWKKLQDDPDKPLLHRAIQSGYPPGSTLKMAILAAGLEYGAIDRNFTAQCPGSFQLGRRTYHCWKSEGHGTVGVLKSLEESCDVFYYKAGLEAGLDAIETTLRTFRFGRPTGIDLDGEAAGLVPSRAYYDKRYGPRGWTKGLIPNISIGQGEVLVKPIQMARFSAILATRGQCMQPHLYGGVAPAKWQSFGTGGIQRSTVELRPETWDILQEGMHRVLHGDHGTAHWLNPSIPMAGKTGTAQNPHGKDHAWFIAYAPYENPKIAVAVLVEHGEHGSSTAAPIAVKLIYEFLRMNPSQEYLASHINEPPPQPVVTE
jgi:penicillin-binding protein 2